MEDNKKTEIITRIKVLLFFIYLLFYYIYGSDTQKVKYSEIILLIFIVLEGIRIIKTKKIKCCIPIIIMFAFAFYCFLSSFWAIDPDKSILMSKTLFILCIFLFIGYNFFLNLDNGEDKLLKIIMYSGIAFSIYIIIYYGIGNYFTRLMNGERMGAEIDNVNIIGLETSISFIISIFYGLYDNKKIYYLLSIIPLIIALGTGSKKVIIIVTIGILLMFLLKRDEKINLKNKIKKIVTLIIIFLIFVLIMKLPVFSNIFKRFESLINITRGEGVVDNSTRLRKAFISAGFEQFLKTPILGIGISNSSFITTSVQNGFATYLHNNYVELLACTGIVGFSLYYSIYFYIIYYSIKFLKNNNKYINIVLVIFLVNLIIEYGIVSYSSKSTYVYIILALISVQNERRKLKDEKDTKSNI